MRVGRILAWTVGGVAALLIVLVALLQTGPGQRTAAGVLGSLASSADNSVQISGLEGVFPTDMRVAQVVLADRQGAWLRADDIRLRWSLASLFTGRMHIDELSARHLEALRAPLPAQSAESSKGGLGLPVGVDLQSLEIPDIHIGAALAAGVDSRWNLKGSALLAADGSHSRLKLDMARADGPAGRVNADLVFDLEPLALNGTLAIEEPDKGGVIAALLDRPDLDWVSARLVAQGDRDQGSAQLSASAQDVLNSTGRANWHRSGNATTVDFTLDAQSTALGQAHATTSGSYDMGADRLVATTVLDMQTAGPLRDRIAGLDWQGLHLEAKADLSKLKATPAGTATFTGSIDNLLYAPLAPTPVKLAATLDLQRDGRLNLKSLALSSPLADIKGSGNYLPSTGAGGAKLAVDGSNLSLFSALAGLPLEGRTHVDLDLTVGKDGLGIGWQGTIAGLKLPPIPPPLAQENLQLSGQGQLRKDGAWQVDRAKVAGDRAGFDFSGHGKSDTGELSMALSLPHLELLEPRATGSATIKTTLAFTADRASGQFDAEGNVADHPLALSGRFSRGADGSVSIPSVQGHWASADVGVRYLAVTPQATTGAGHVSIARLEDLQPLLGGDLAGSLDLDIATEPDPIGKVRLALRGERLRGQGVAIASARVDGTVSDPLGKAQTDATVKVTGMGGAGGISQVNATVRGDRDGLTAEVSATGQGIAASLAATAQASGEDVHVALHRFTGRYRDIPASLTAPSRIDVAGSRIVIQPAALSVGQGRVGISGTLDSANSNLTVQIAQLPLSLVEGFAPGTGLEGSLQGKVQVTGALADPQIQASYSVSGVRVRQPQTRLIPALAAQGTASVVHQRATFDASVAAGGATRLALKGEAQLPQGKAALRGRISVRGSLDLAPFAMALGNDLRNVAGTARPDVTLTVNGNTIEGSGTVSLTGVALYLPDSGLRLSDGQGNIVLQGNTVQLQRFTFQTARGGELTASGTVRLDKDLPVDLAVTTRKALLVNRPDLLASISSDIKVTGSQATGIDVRGMVNIDRAEIGIGVSQAGNYPLVAVKEVNGTSPSDAYLPKPPPPPGSKGAASNGIRLALNVQATQAVYARGRGLNAELGGKFTVTGNPSQPSVLGSLSLRRGTFSLAGRQLNFTRGNVSLVSASVIDPLLDFAATTTVESTTIEIDITGTSREPKIAITSSPPLPQDEAMAMLLFGKPSTNLSPSELLIAAQTIADLSSGSPVESGFFGRLRKTLSLDQLSVGASSSSSRSGTSGSSDIGGTSVRGGRYVAPGVYVGAEQGTTTTSTRGVVEIDVLKHTKIEGAVGADSNDRIGAKMEWDY